MISCETAHNPNFAVSQDQLNSVDEPFSFSSGYQMKALSGRVRILKNSKLKLRVGSKKRDAMTSDSSKDKTEEFLSGVVEGKRISFGR